jgi:CrcB protein
LYRLLLVFVGSGVGGALRYLFALWVERSFRTSFPLWTLGVNVIGSFLIMIVMHLGVERGAISPEIRILLTTGVMGGFTTYSAFNYETVRFFEHHAFGMGLLNIGVTVVACLLAGALAVGLTRWLT